MQTKACHNGRCYNRKLMLGWKDLSYLVILKNLYKFAYILIEVFN